MSGKVTIDRTKFEKLFGNTLEAIRKNDFGRIFKDVVGARRGSRAISVWARGTGCGLSEMSIDTGYTVERHGVLRFSQGEGALELSVCFTSEDDPVGVIEVATRGGQPVTPDEMDKHVQAVAKALDHALRDKLPPARLVPPPTVPFRLWAADSGDRPAATAPWSGEPALSVKLFASQQAAGQAARLPNNGVETAQPCDVVELWSQIRTLIDQRNPG